MSSPGIVASGVRRSFGSVHAVRDVNLEARAGAVTGLVGPNGSGKTTLLLMLASLLAPDAGVLRIGGLDPVADPAGVRRIVGWMPDALGAWPSLTARETLVMTSRLYGIAPADAERGAARLLDELGLAENGLAIEEADRFAAPGAFEMPLLAQALAETRRYAGIICLGCVIKGDTAHFEFISLGTTVGIMQASLATRTPIAFGILTTYTEDQAVARSRRADAHNKGREAAAACVASARLLAQIGQE